MKPKGTLKIHALLEDTQIPVTDVKVKILRGDRSFNHVEEIKEVTTNDHGIVSDIELDAFYNSTEQNGESKDFPYGIYNLICSKDGFKTSVIKGVQVFPNRVAIQYCRMEKGDEGNCGIREITIPEHKQVNQECSKCSNVDYSTKFKEITSKKKEKNKEKPIKEKTKKSCKRGYRVLSQPEVPQYITVHTGAPTNSEAPNYTVSFVDYIKNVGSSELYSTWNSDCLRANIYCIVSFALNRVYTEWYPSRGYDFDITNDTAYDQAFVYGRTIYNSISTIVDQLFSTYIEEQGTDYPMFSQFCNGTTSVCPGWLSQWGSEYLGTQGYTPYEILTYYYGGNLNLVTAETVTGYPDSYPGYYLNLWTSGEPVKTVQTQLNRIAQNYPAIGQLVVDGIYGPKTEGAVKVFQSIFNIPQTGIVNYGTWYAISRVYIGVTGESN
ncbi:MAG: peptidoglycan-binding protein [Sarcina sp.]